MGSISPLLQNYQGPALAPRVLIPVVISMLTEAAVSRREKTCWILCQWYLLRCNEANHDSCTGYKAWHKWYGYHQGLQRGWLLNQGEVVRMRALWLRPEKVALAARTAWTVLEDGRWLEKVWDVSYWWMEKKLGKPCGRSLSCQVCNGSFQRTESSPFFQAQDTTEKGEPVHKP